MYIALAAVAVICFLIILISVAYALNSFKKILREDALSSDENEEDDI